MPHTSDSGPGGLEEIHAKHPHRTGRITAFGAHALGWQPAGHEPVLYLSPRAVLDGSKAIRGGIPVCFPWFGSGPSGDREPSHGPVRTATWQRTEPADADVAFSIDAEGFTLRLAASFRDTLVLAVRVQRVAETAAPFELALHSYFAVSSVAGVRVTGLAGASRLDQLTGERSTQSDGPIRFDGEYDRVFTGAHGPQTLHDPGGGSESGAGRRIVLTPENLPSAIVWNPGPAKAASMSDLGEDQFDKFVCIESGRVREDALTLGPGEVFEAAVRFTVEPTDDARA